MSQAQQEAILRGKQETFGEFIYNSEKGEFLGRTGISWLKIFVFYCIYYGFLAAFFALCMFLFYQTLDTGEFDLPKYTPGNDDSILRNPSLGYRPRPPSDNIESSMIYYEMGKEHTYEKWTTSMNELLDGTEEPERNYTRVENYENVETCDKNTVLTPGHVCDVDIEHLGNHCHKDNNWGYAGDSPCILLKLNRMIGWKPNVYEKVEQLPDDMPHDLREHIKDETNNNNGVMPKMLWVSCHGESPLDNEMLTEGVTYLPERGFPLHYFPYENQKNYLSPLIAVQFNKPRPNILIHVRCTLYAHGITYSNKEQIGLVGMQFLIDQKD